jgi:hypothetical protein
MDDALEQRIDPAFLQARAQAFTVSVCVDGYAALIDNPNS